MTGIITKSQTVIPKVVRVNAFWDAEAEVWCASSTNLSEVITCAPTIPTLIEMITDVIELILEDDGAPAGCTVGVKLSVKQPVNGAEVVVPELAETTKELATIVRESKNACTDLAPAELIFKQSFDVANGVAKL